MERNLLLFVVFVSQEEFQSNPIVCVQFYLWNIAQLLRSVVFLLDCVCVCVCVCLPSCAVLLSSGHVLPVLCLLLKCDVTGARKLISSTVPSGNIQIAVHGNVCVCVCVCVCVLYRGL